MLANQNGHNVYGLPYDNVYCIMSTNNISYVQTGIHHPRENWILQNSRQDQPKMQKTFIWQISKTIN